MEKNTEPVGVCEHAFVPVKPLSEMLKKCAACEKRKKWLWAKMTKCSRKYDNSIIVIIVYE